MRNESLPAGWTVRPARMDDASCVLEMLDARWKMPYGDVAPSLQRIEASWTSPRFNLAADTCLVLDETRTAAGIASVMNPGEPYSEFVPSVVVHPRYADRDGLWDALTSWGLERAQELVSLAADRQRVIAACRTSALDTARRDALERAGFGGVRVANRMRIDLVAPFTNASWPDDISTRNADVDGDLEAIARLYLETWREQRGSFDMPLEVAVAGFREDIAHEGASFDPTLWFLAVDGEALAGFALCKSNVAGDTKHGYVGALGVSVTYRQRGIASALLRHAFAEFGRRGHQAVELDVDTENATGALGVYERVGMRVVRQSIAYEKELRPAS